VGTGAGTVTVTVTAELVDEVNTAASVGVKTAVIECEPAVVKVLLADAAPLATVTGPPRLVEPSLNCTVPGAELGDTVADRATEAPVDTEVGAADAVVVVVTAPTGGVVTVTVAAALVDAVNAFTSAGVKTAVIEWDPAVENEVVTVAEPLVTVTGLAMLVEPSLNCTVPAAELGDTLADSATEAPVTTEVGAADTVVLVVTAGAVTETRTAELVDEVNALASAGVKTAVIECEPAVLNVVVADADPLDTVTGVLMSAEPSLNCTVPAAAGDTVAPKVTAPPTSAAEGVAVAVVVVVVAPTGGAVTVTELAALVDAV
jgi:hypothetical protein